MDPVVAVYCPECGLPAEYCEFGSQSIFKSRCLPWLMENMDKDWLVEQGLADDEEAPVDAMANVTLDGTEGEAAEGEGAPAEGKVKGPQTTKKGSKLKDGDKVMPGGKVKKKQAPCVLVQRLQRNKRKFVTVVIGLEHFGIKLKDAAQAFKKKFSCGSSVVAGECGKPDEIDIQGDFVYETIELVLKKFPEQLTAENVFVLENGKKTCATDL